MNETYYSPFHITLLELFFRGAFEGFDFPKILSNRVFQHQASINLQNGF